MSGGSLGDTGFEFCQRIVEPEVRADVGGFGGAEAIEQVSYRSIRTGTGQRGNADFQQVVVRMRDQTSVGTQQVPNQ